MEKENLIDPIRIIILILNPKLGEQARAIFRGENVQVGMEISATGTAPGNLSEAFGVGNIDKILFVAALPLGDADHLLRTMNKEMHLYRANSGIGFTIPVNAANRHFIRILQSETTADPEKTTHKGDNMPGSEYALITAVINQGFSEDVISAAREVGAVGGTIVHSRQMLNEKTAGAWGFSLQEDRETVLILARTEKKSAIMKAISDRCGIQTEARGIVLSLPVDQQIGILKNDF